MRWDAALLQAPLDVAVEAWKRSLHGFAKRMPPREQARFLMELDSACYFMHGESATLANNGLHPKHRLIAYHDFFVSHASPGERIIDLGSGVGALALSLATAGVRVTGIEWSASNVSKAQSLCAGVEPAPLFVFGDITSLRIPESFDTVILSNVLEHITDRPRRLAQWASWYKPRRFLIRVPAFERDWRVAWKKDLGVEWRCDPTHETEHTREQLLAELAEAGLKVMHLETSWGEYRVVADNTNVF